MRRIYLENENIVSGDKSIKLSGSVFHYLKRVLREKEGNEFIGFDGMGKEYKIQIRKIAGNYMEGVVIEEVEKVFETEPPFNIILCQSVPRINKMDFIIREITQLGVRRIVPVLSDRVVPVLNEEKIKKRTMRWKKIIQEASRISKRTITPEISPVVTFKNAVKMVQSDFTLIFWEGETIPVKEAMKFIPEGKNFSVKIFIGPEGGYTEEEVNLAKESGAFSVSLGKRILKVETAAVVATAIVLYELGNL